MSTVKFTKNFKDRSSDTGFQFEFFCDRNMGTWMPGWLAYHFPESCHFSYISAMQSYPVAVANRVKEAASWLASRFPQISGAGEALKTIHKEAWDNAFAASVAEAKREFRNCGGCGKWVCAHSCWNEANRICRGCSLAAGMIKPGSPKRPLEARCAHCGQMTEPGQFCSSCGHSMAMQIFCGNCGKKIESDRRFRFCPHCGDSLAYLEDGLQDGKESA